ncbi:MAG: cephalosporin hydroxylase [Planctomycetes bacterium]|nr:cephalosporin hydroxylase [Planctomycetota bacterium]
MTTTPETAPAPTPTDPVAAFAVERREQIAALGRDEELRRRSVEWIMRATPNRFTYNFSWMGRPVIQFPADMIAIQELIWSTRPNVIIETGIAHGGSAVFSASMLELLGGDGRVVAVDIDIREHNRAAIEEHPMSRRITMIEGSSIDSGIVNRVRGHVGDGDRVMVILDSHHSHAHVLAELEAYGPLVTRDCYLVVLDTIIEDLPAGFLSDTRWDKGDNPKTAVHAYIGGTGDFEIDRAIPDKLQITTAPDGYLRCIRP